MPSWACTCRCWAARRPRSRPRGPHRGLLEKARPGAYHKAMVGKWDLGAASPKYIPTAGASTASPGFYNAMIDYFDWTTEGPVSDIAGTVVDAQRNDGPAPTAAGRYTTRLRDAALGEVAAAKARARRSFCAAWNAIHYDVAIPDARTRGAAARVREGPGARPVADAGDRPGSCASSTRRTSGSTRA